jgi:hypothetical protein
MSFLLSSAVKTVKIWKCQLEHLLGYGDDQRSECAGPDEGMRAVSRVRLRVAGRRRQERAEGKNIIRHVRPAVAGQARLLVCRRRRSRIWNLLSGELIDSKSSLHCTVLHVIGSLLIAKRQSPLSHRTYAILLKSQRKLCGKLACDYFG